MAERARLAGGEACALALPATASQVSSWRATLVTNGMTARRSRGDGQQAGTGSTLLQRTYRKLGIATQVQVVRQVLRVFLLAR